MKAIQIINPGKNYELKIEEHPAPDPGPHELLVKIEAAALNRADLNQCAGNYPPPKGVTEIPGLEMAGIVEAVGEEVNRWKPGDTVFGLLPGGGYAEYCVIPEAMALPLAEELSFEEAAAIPETFLTAWQALQWVGKLKEKETVLIHAGGSGVGTSAIQLARHLFDATIITTAGKQHKLDTCLELGANYAFNYKEQDFAEAIKKELAEAPVNLIIDFIGAPYWNKNIDVMAMDGRLVYLSFLGGTKLQQISLGPLLRKRLTLTGSTLRSRSPEYKTDLTQDFLKHCLKLFNNGSLKAVIDSVYDWQDIMQAHRRMADNKNTGKIVIRGM